MGEWTGVGDAVRFRERIPGEVGRKSCALRLSSPVVPVAVGAGQNRTRYGGVFGSHRSSKRAAGSRDAALIDLPASLLFWCQSELWKQRGGGGERGGNWF